jgi:hypothetical protein
MYTVKITLENGRIIVCCGFETSDEALRFCWAIDQNEFGYNNIQIEKSN